MIGFLAIFAAALSGYSGIGVWAIAAAALALAALSQAEFSKVYKQARDQGHDAIAHSTAMHSLLNALLAASGAYAVGVVVRMI